MPFLTLGRVAFFAKIEILRS